MNYIVIERQSQDIFSCIENLKKLWHADVSHETLNDNFQIFYSGGNPLVRSEGTLAAVEGWLGTYKNGYSPESAIRKIVEDKWPLSNDFTGMFSAGIISDYGQTLCNDLLGMNPLYYHLSNEKLAFGNSLVAFTIFSKLDLDPVGIFQRRYSQTNSNFGSRTILKQVKRLLPGELISVVNGKIANRIFDQTLYHFNPDKAQKVKEEAEKYWDFLRTEYSIGLSQFDNIYLGLSGGIDSRLMMLFVPDEKQKTLVTYGSYEDEVEVAIAKRVSDLVPNATFLFTPVNNSHFPKYELVNHIVGSTESYYNNHWVPLYETPMTTI